MRTQLLCLFCFTIAATNFTKAQTLFTYGTHAVSKKEFLDAYNKNPDTTTNKEQSLKDYLDLYINFRLKLQAAYDEKANINPDLIGEAENFKGQLAENYINKQADITQLLHQAFERSRKDILLQQVFVKFDGNDTAQAYTTIQKAYADLKTGKGFEDVATSYATDSSVKAGHGNVGYITVFTLPYKLETFVYNIKPGSYSGIYKSSAGYHIFKNVSERPALGRRKIEQLLFNLFPGYNNEQEVAVKHTADSIYNLLQRGVPFQPLFAVYGHTSYDQGPNIMEVKVGDYDANFEEQVFSLKNPGDITNPFKTDYGYNIVKLDQVLPVPDNENDINYIGWLQTQIQNDGRLDAAKNALVDSWLTVTGFKETPYNHADLWIYTDSAMKNAVKPPVHYKGFEPETVLFQFSKEKFSVKNWIYYLNSLGISGNENKKTDYEKLMHDYIRVSCGAYYRKHIEDFDTSAKEQLKEFNDANMLFYVMDKHVWSKASEDSIGLKKYYTQHAAEYQWKQSVNAFVISAPDKITADSIALKIKNDPQHWRNIVASYNNVYADSNRYETDQLPVHQQVIAEKDFQTTPEANEAGDSYTFIHVLRVYDQPQQKSFEEAKGIVINAYQQELEKQWLDALKKQYPVKVNTTTLDTLLHK
jgi:peptidyl-prolyl cis-trans isomerase SurA